MGTNTNTARNAARKQKGIAPIHEPNQMFIFMLTPVEIALLVIALALSAVFWFDMGVSIPWLEDPVSLELAPQEERIIHLNPWWHRTFKVQDEGLVVSTQIFETLPPKRPTPLKITVNETMYIDPEEYTFKARFLHTGSNVSITWESTDPAKFIIVDSEERFHAWEAEEPITLLHEDRDDDGELSLESIEHDGDFYFCWENPSKDKTIRVDVTFDIQSSAMDLSEGVVAPSNEAVWLVSPLAALVHRRQPQPVVIVRNPLKDMTRMIQVVVTVRLSEYIAALMVCVVVIKWLLRFRQRLRHQSALRSLEAES